MNEMIFLNPVLLIAIPLGLAFLIPLLGLISKKIVKWIPILGFLFNMVTAISLLPQILNAAIIVKIGGFQPPFSINLVVGPVGILFSLLISLAGFLVAIYSLKYIKQ